MLKELKYKTLGEAKKFLLDADDFEEECASGSEEKDQFSTGVNLVVGSGARGLIDICSGGPICKDTKIFGGIYSDPERDVREARSQAFFDEMRRNEVYSFIRDIPYSIMGERGSCFHEGKVLVGYFSPDQPSFLDNMFGANLRGRCTELLLEGEFDKVYERFSKFERVVEKKKNELGEEYDRTRFVSSDASFFRPSCYQVIKTGIGPVRKVIVPVVRSWYPIRGNDLSYGEWHIYDLFSGALEVRRFDQLNLQKDLSGVKAILINSQLFDRFGFCPVWPESHDGVGRRVVNDLWAGTRIDYPNGLFKFVHEKGFTTNASEDFPPSLTKKYTRITVERLCVDVGGCWARVANDEGCFSNWVFVDNYNIPRLLCCASGDLIISIKNLLSTFVNASVPSRESFDKMREILFCEPAKFPGLISDGFDELDLCGIKLPGKTNQSSVFDSVFLSESELFVRCHDICIGDGGVLSLINFAEGLLPDFSPAVVRKIQKELLHLDQSICSRCLQGWLGVDFFNKKISLYSLDLEPFLQVSFAGLLEELPFLSPRVP